MDVQKICEGSEFFGQFFFFLCFKRRCFFVFFMSYMFFVVLSCDWFLIGKLFVGVVICYVIYDKNVKLKKMISCQKINLYDINFGIEENGII